MKRSVPTITLNAFAVLAGGISSASAQDTVHLSWKQVKQLAATACKNSRPLLGPLRAISRPASPPSTASISQSRYGMLKKDRALATEHAEMAKEAGK